MSNLIPSVAEFEQHILDLFESGARSAFQFPPMGIGRPSCFTHIDGWRINFVFKKDDGWNIAGDLQTRQNLSAAYIDFIMHNAVRHVGSWDRLQFGDPYQNGQYAFFATAPRDHARITAMIPVESRFAGDIMRRMPELRQIETWKGEDLS